MQERSWLGDLPGKILVERSTNRGKYSWQYAGLVRLKEKSESPSKPQQLPNTWRTMWISVITTVSPTRKTNINGSGTDCIDQDDAIRGIFGNLKIVHPPSIELCHHSDR